MLIFHTTGDWVAGRVRVTWTGCTRALVPEVEQAIDRAWRQSAQRRDITLFDGPMCRLESWSATPAELHLALARTSYRLFWGTNMLNPHLADRYGARILANPVGVSPALLSSDGYLVLGRRNASVAYYPNRLHPFAGALEPGEGLDVFQEVRRELREELSFDDQDIVGIRCTGLVEDVSLRQPELIFAVQSTRTRDQIAAQVDRSEHGGSWSLPATRPALDATLREPHAFTPVAVAAMLLWGRGAFGDAWFTAMAARFGRPAPPRDAS